MSDHRDFTHGVTSTLFAFALPEGAITLTERVLFAILAACASTVFSRLMNAGIDKLTGKGKKHD